jgi:aminoglycoside 3-N-acetyltransferase
VATRGAKAKEFAQAEVGDAFGARSVFGLLDHYNAWIVCLACSLDQITYTHYIEQNFGVDYRYFKYFKYVILKKEEEEKGLIRYFVRDLNRQTNLKLDCLKKRLKITKGLKKASIGRFSIYCITSSKFKTEANNLLQQNNNSLILEGSLQKTHSKARNIQIIK